MSVRRERARGAALGAALALVAPLVAACGGDEGAARFRPLAVGAPAPTYAVALLGGDSARVQPGEPPTLLNVWATWCVPCERELPDLQRLHERHAGRGLRVLAVSIDAGGRAPVAAYVRERGLTFPIGHDPDERIRARYQTIGVPETYLVGADGRLLWRHIGQLPPDGGAKLDSVIRAALPPAS